LQNQHRKEKEEGMNGITELALWKEKPQSGTEDDLWTLRKYCSDLQKEKLSLTHDNDALRTERDELKTDFDELKIKYSALIDDLKAIREENDVLLRDKAKLIAVDGRMKMMLDELSSIQRAHLILTQDRDTLRSDHEKLKISLEELIRECSAQKYNLNIISEKCDALQRMKDALPGVEATVKTLLDEESSIQYPHFLLTQEWDTLRSEYEEVKGNFHDLIQECSFLRKKLNAMKEELDVLQKDKHNLIHPEGRIKTMLDEQSSIQRARLIASQERDALRSGRERLKFYFDEMERVRNALNENVDILREDHDALRGINMS
jgi:chromosome segregation ATPase